MSEALTQLAVATKDPSWVQLAKRVCALVVETAASEKMSNKSNLRSLHKAGVFGSLCRLLKTLMRLAERLCFFCSTCIPACK